MASMFDQYSSALIRENTSEPDPSNRPQSSGYVSVRIKKEPPIFSKQKMQISLKAPILFLSVQNNWTMILMADLTILRMNIEQSDKYTLVSIDKYVAGFRCSNLFLDPVGAHLFITLAPKTPGLPYELLYLQRNSFKPKFIPKLKDQEITAIAFNNSNNSDMMTGPILLGTSKGTIWEADIGIDSADKLVQQNIRQVFDMRRNDGKPNPITGIEFHVRQDQKNVHCVILVLTLERIYKFHETLSPSDGKMASGQLQKIFEPYLNIPEHIVSNYEIVRSHLNYSKLAFNREEDFPKSFGCLTEDGINFQEINPKTNTLEFAPVEVIPYPPQEDMVQQHPENSYKVAPKLNTPLSFVLTDFHAILLYTDHVTAISLLNYQIVYEEYFVEQLGKLCNVLKDLHSNTTYVYSNKMIFRYKINNEQRNAWRLYAERQKFDLALQYCNDNPAHRDIVLVQKAQSLFVLGKYLEAARIYSDTQLSFEEVCLKFLERTQNDALMLYLQNRLDKLKSKEKTQTTMLIVWIVELFLVEISRSAGSNPERERMLQKEFDAFMRKSIVVDCMQKNRSVIYDLMASHGDSYNLTKLTMNNQDFEGVIQQYINQNKLEDALGMLRAQNSQELIYKYAPIIMEELPTETVAVLINQGKRLNPIKLIPSLLCLESTKHIAEIVKYLEYCIHSTHCSEPAVHNYLIQLYSEHFPDKLLTFLETQGNEISMISYDAHYALRICLKHQIRDASVFLQTLLNMWVPAVELALTFDTQLAKHTASQPSDKSLRKKLWLTIAEKEIRDKQENVQEALQILKECDLLRIEDLLPYFSDFQKIDHFKEAICESLKEYNIKIQEQRKDMEDSAISAERVRSKLQTFRNRSVHIGAHEQCAICGVYLLMKPFFIFHCGHKFHGDCLETRLLPQLKPEVLHHLESLKQQLTVAQNQPQDTISGISTNKEHLKSQIEDILVSDCLFCGEVMISTIDRSFIDNWERVDSDWQ
ncbi:vacuolar protein sorting-associated protein 18 homolog [Armigeres subalbatus]|uniref:vacuolar protein sorting-associated protein 18 homolog n=1 Tax=Armigeres subalbatus TaxID=124917 RepID=UPI002ED081EB